MVRSWPSLYSWRCPICLLRVMPDRREHGLVFSSPLTVSSEFFLFELAVNLSRNGCSLRSYSYLRSGYRELTASTKYAPRSSRLRSVATFRKALTLYPSLAIKGLPLDVSNCAHCVSSSGVIDVVCFDGLQLGYKHKYKRRFHRDTIRTSGIPRASVHAHMVTDSATAKALGSVFNTASKMAAGSSMTVTTVTAMRGYVMAASTLLGNVSVNGREMTFEGSVQNGMSASTTGRGWCRTATAGCGLLWRHFCAASFAASWWPAPCAPKFWRPVWTCTGWCPSRS